MGGERFSELKAYFENYDSLPEEITWKYVETFKSEGGFGQIISLSLEEVRWSDNEGHCSIIRSAEY